ncbi:MAG TPA: hypothetical protein VFV67_16225 [Actinophytocola sp.]|uniref:hypothetical protein n=1 Tax=Actinophytocola sp. TaxID=1872138 RepID=UPI002DB6BB74|nr:hypothetical protein [Actinophytocola sp.]HEU5472201.1 hypothetical protein [Actinophytocola sp.]
MSSPGLDPWSSFPVDQVPRPLVLTLRSPVLDGYTSGEAKMAGEVGNYEMTGPFPDAPPTVTAQLPDGPVEFRTLPAEGALAAMRETGTPSPEPTTPIRIQRAELGTAPFRTDRGELVLPAWRFHSTDTLSPMAWPALPEEAFFAHDKPYPVHAGPARLGADGTLTVTLPAPSPPCPGEEPTRTEPLATETDTAVEVTVRFHPPASGGFCEQVAMLRMAEYRFRLAKPLGNRVLVDEKGSPIAVTG